MLDDEKNHLAFIGTRHNYKIPFYDSENDRELSQFNEFISNLEAEVILEYFKLERSLDSETAWGTAVFITDENSEIVYQTEPELT